MARTIFAPYQRRGQVQSIGSTQFITRQQAFGKLSPLFGRLHFIPETEKESH
jgi:hypothetical protein